VVDNFGDIGVCWRLARQLAHEHRIAIRLWVDNLKTFSKLCPEVNVHLDRQHCDGVEVLHWTETFPDVEPAALVIEAFACKLPESYVISMAGKQHKPVWINLEYLSAEDWVEGCHKLPSPHPTLPLTKYFFFPGFTPETGGLLVEHDLLNRRNAFQNNLAQQQAFWQSVGLPPPAPDTLKVSLFCYENSSLCELFDTWVQGTQTVLCLAPEGRILPQIEKYFEQLPKSGTRCFSLGNLQVCIVPFVEQERYDELLWVCDFNFVRGEDSCVRAQWAGKPFIWQIYPQHDGVHMQKLRAFMNLYGADLPADTLQTMQRLWETWNQIQEPIQPHATKTVQAWNDYLTHQSILLKHALAWSKALSSNNLALNLLDFFSSIDRMRDSQNFSTYRQTL
jgi:uncharacterized repeat protein (TIGR03837 family)